MRARALLLLAAVAVALTAGCSGESSSESDAPLTTTVPVGDAAAPVTVADDPAATVPSTTAPPEPVTMTVQIRVPDAGVDDELSAELSTTGDPFGDFASCSGIRREVGAYSVLMSRTDGDVRSVSVLSTTRVAGSGTLDADVRVERRDGAAIVAAGTLTVDAGLRSGSFLAFDAEGRRVEGGFECLDTELPEPIGVNDGPSVEVVALLRLGDTERVVSLASSDPSWVSCPGAVDDQPLVLRADDGVGLGSLTTFELTADGDEASMRMRIGGEVEEFSVVELELDDERLAGTFAATDGDLVVDGAFTCE